MDSHDDATTHIEDDDCDRPSDVDLSRPAQPRGLLDTGGLDWINLAAESVERSASLSADCKILRANVVSVGRRQDAYPTKFLGLRPDVCQHLGTEQMEWTFLSAEFDGKAVDYDPRDIVVYQHRQRCRHMVAPPGPCTSFRLQFRLDLTGLKVVPMHGEYWLYSIETGDFRFRIRQPSIIDPKTQQPPVAGPLETPLDGLVEHSLIFDGKSWLYTKSSTPGFARAVKDGLLPNGFLIDADTYYSTTADGWIRSPSDADWSVVHSAGSGSSVDDNDSSYAYAIRALLTGSDYYIFRAFFVADTSAASSPASATWSVYGRDNEDSNVSYFLGTQHATLEADDFDAFSGAEYGHVAWDASGWNTQAITPGDVNTSGTTKLCLREYEHDVSNEAPDAIYTCGCRFADYTGTTSDPYLEITEGAANYRSRIIIIG